MSTKYHKVSAVASVDGVSMDITQFTVTYAVNSIPTATVVVPTGRPALTAGGSTAKALASIGRRKPMSITLTTTGEVLGGGTGKVFDGYTSSISSSCSPGTYGIQLGGVGWLDDLRGTSAFSDVRTPLSCYDVEAPRTFLAGSGVVTEALDIKGAIAALAVRIKKGADIGQIIYDLAEGVAGGGKVVVGGVSGPYKNTAALIALAHVKNTLTFGFKTVAVMEYGAASIIASAILSLYNGGAIWTALVDLADQFMFMIAPTINDATLAAYDPMLRTPALKLTTEDYVYIRNIGITRRPIAAMLLITSQDSNSGLVTGVPRPISIAVSGEESGLLDVVPCPGWLIKNALSTTTRTTYPLTEGIRVRAWAGKVVEPPAKGTSLEELLGAGLGAVRAVGATYARAAMADRMFADSTATIVGPLRFDVAPGMVIAVETMGTGKLSAGPVLYGFVTAVSTEVNAQTGTAATTIMLSHVRNESDNVKYGTSVSALYSTSYTTKGLKTGGSGKLIAGSGAAPTAGGVVTKRTSASGLTITSAATTAATATASGLSASGGRAIKVITGGSVTPLTGSKFSSGSMGGTGFVTGPIKSLTGSSGAFTPTGFTTSLTKSGFAPIVPVK